MNLEQRSHGFSHKISDFEAIIFDLGGVVLPINYQKTADSIRELGLEDFDKLYSKAQQEGLFDRFETGEISAQHFINQLLDFFPVKISPNKIVSAWNDMLLDFPMENLDFLSALKEEKRTFLLSNTNEIHVQAFNRKIKKTANQNSLDPYFEKIYFSNEIGKRKPHPETFEYICSINNLNPSNTLFIDDSIQHIEGAQKIGLQTHHFQAGESILSLFEKWNLKT